ncbi:MAG: polyprenyl synthetase family protein [Polyangiaceae bacterium]|nr:polyprenyl synthetase family protein [Polyangiaceae bacterium]
MPRDSGFTALVAEVRRDVDARLSGLFEAERARALALSPDAHALARSIEALTMRGGKRQRAALVVLGHRLAGGLDDALAHPGAVALELLQTYLLIHDDWMDGDETRRGGPSVHVMLREHFGGDARRGDAFAVLAGDLSCAMAHEALLAADDPARAQRAARELARMTHDVVLGQALDVAGGSSDLARAYDLKTSSYTVRGPLLVGAALGGASEALSRALETLAGPIGVAFQLADDMLGLFGDERTGKPRGGDLREGKRTSVIVAAEALLDAEGRATLARGGGPEATPAAREAALALLADCGAEAVVRGEIAALVESSQARIAALEAPAEARALLSSAARALTERSS